LLLFYFYILFFNSFFIFESRVTGDLLLALPLNYCVKAKVPTCVQKKKLNYC
jgi:hypothetical protein